MNFFQKLTGSLKMQQEEELFPEEASRNRAQPVASSAPPEPPPQEQTSEETETKAASFKQMLAAEDGSDSASEDIDVGYGENAESADEPANEPEDAGASLATAQLASARTATKKHLSPIKKGLSSLRFRKEEKEETEANAPEGQLAIDVYETPEEVVIKSTIAGVKAQDLDVGIEDNTVNIRGSRHNEEKVKGEDYFYQECYWGTFSRSVILPVEVDVDKTQASLKDGILTVRLPKIIKEKEKKIKILS